MKSIVADNLSNIIKEKCLKQCTVAQKAGYSKQQLTDMLKGRKRIKETDILRLASALDVDVSVLLKTEADSKQSDGASDKQREKERPDLNQIQVSGLTGKSKGSISQYLSDKQVPPEETQVDIALALGLAEDYFSDKNDKFSVLPTKEIRNKIIPRLDINEAAKMLGMNHNTVRKGLQQGVFPWGYGIRTSENRWVYFINAKRFAEIEGIAF